MACFDTSTLAKLLASNKLFMANANSLQDADLNNNGRNIIRRLFERYCGKYWDFVPEEDLAGIDHADIHDNPSNRGPQNVSGGFYPPGKISEGAVIHLYINQTLGNIFSFHRRYNLFSKVSDWLFLVSFGKIFIADTLFHEIGHHKFRADDEVGAVEYSRKLLQETFPFRMRHYDIFNRIYRMIYINRIKHSEKVK